MIGEVGISLIVAVVMVLLVVVAVMLLGGLMHSTRNRATGYFTYVFPMAMFINALLNATSGRNLSASMDSILLAVVAPNAFVDIFRKLASIALVLAALDRVIHHLTLPRAPGQSRQSSGLLLAYLAFWIGTVASPALFGAHKHLSHEYLYPLLFGWAALTTAEGDAEAALLMARNTMIAFILTSWLTVAIKPDLVMEWHYAQGLIPGLPRFTGLAPHAISMAMLTLVGLLCLWARPLQRPTLNALAWVIGLATLLMAQSKTTWISFVVCALLIFAIRHGSTAWNTMTSRRHATFTATVLGTLMLLLIAMGMVVIFGSAGEGIERFFNTSEGARLASLTGRDQIWAATLREWSLSPLFGYGLTMFDPDFRMRIGLLVATHAHNQFMDTLGRSGLIGAATLVVYCAVLSTLSLRCARRSGGLSLALFAAIALRGISEVPLTLMGYGPEFLAHLLLLIVLARYAHAPVRQNAVSRAGDSTHPAAPRNLREQHP